MGSGGDLLERYCKAYRTVVYEIGRPSHAAAVELLRAVTAELAEAEEAVRRERAKRCPARISERLFSAMRRKAAEKRGPTARGRSRSTLGGGELAPAERHEPDRPGGLV